MARQSKGLGMSLVISLGTLAVIFVSLFVLSGNFSSLVTTILKPKASMAIPKITESFSDPFKTGTLNTDKWTVSNNGDNVKVWETPSDNLRFDISEGKTSDTVKYKAGRLVYKKSLLADKDFRISAVIYRPLVTGKGQGNTGIGFATTSTLDDEGASLYWKVASGSSEVVFTVTAPDKSVIMHKVQDLNSNVGVFTLLRVNNTYRAWFHGGADMTGDDKAIVLGEVQNSALGQQDGMVRLFTNNNGKSDNPKVVGRIDQVTIGWEGKPAPDRESLSDNFGDGTISTNWKVNTSEGSSVIENKAQRLAITIPAGALNKKVRGANVTRKTPVIPGDKDFVLNTEIMRPKVVGGGVGVSGVTYQTDTSTQDEAATVRWLVSKDAEHTSQVAFTVAGPNGTIIEKAIETIPANTQRLWLSLQRRGDKYVGVYRIGDSDGTWVAIGKEENSALGNANGKVSLFTRQEGNKFPFVIGQFNTVIGWVAK